jgi:hypothetical protein
MTRPPPTYGPCPTCGNDDRPIREHHNILNYIKRYLWINQSPSCCYRDLRQHPESISFRDPTTGRRYEIVVRAIDGDDGVGRHGPGDRA